MNVDGLGVQVTAFIVKDLQQALDICMRGENTGKDRE